MWFYRSVSLSFLLLLGGCALRPLYGEESGDVAQKMRQIYVAPISDRSGQMLHNLLQQILTPQGVKNPRYTLRVVLSTVRQEMAFLKDGTASRLQIQLTAQYGLENYVDGTLLEKGELLSCADYNIVVDGDYATVVSEEDAMARALRDIAWDIKASLGVLCLETSS